MDKKELNKYIRKWQKEIQQTKNAIKLLENCLFEFEEISYQTKGSSLDKIFSNLLKIDRFILDTITIEEISSEMTKVRDKIKYNE